MLANIILNKTLFTDTQAITILFFIFFSFIRTRLPQSPHDLSLHSAWGWSPATSNICGMESNLKFIETWEVAQFKAQQGVEKLEVKQNPHTGKVFFVYGLETGPCSRKVETGQLTDPVVSQVCNAETGELFMMLHQRGEGGAPTLAVF